MQPTDVHWPEPWKLLSPENLDDLDPKKEIIDKNLELVSGGLAINQELAKAQGKDPETNLNEDAHKWFLFENIKTGRCLFIRAHTEFTNTYSGMKIDSLIFPMLLTKSITAKDLRSISIPEFERCLSSLYLSRIIEMRRHAFLIPYSIKGIDYARPLPRNKNLDDSFYALAAEQYERIKKKNPDKDAIKITAEINKVAYSTIQSWLATARKTGLLMPSSRGRKTKTLPNQ